MNIFVLDRCQSICAKWHMDKHIVKMPLETAQMLCTAIIVRGGEAPYKIAHKNHPCSIWARETTDNFMWLLNLGVELCKEYTFRYGKVHKCLEVIVGCEKQLGLIPKGSLTEFVQAMPDEYKKDDPIEGYRAYYIGAKARMAAWKMRSIPDWFKEQQE
jgi:hypothetical protein